MIAQGRVRLSILGQPPAPESEPPDPLPSAVVSARGDLSSAIEPGHWPDEDGLTRLVDARIFRLTMAAPIMLGATEPKQTLEFLRFNRDCLSFGIDLDWTGSVEPTLDGSVLSHLIPPRADGARLHADWMRDHRQGRCYWRNGPGFVSIKDTRAGRQAARFVLDAPKMVALFLRLGSVQRADDASADAQDLGALLDEGLVMSLDGWLLALPYRMRRWPIPALAV